MKRHQSLLEKAKAIKCSRYAKNNKENYSEVAVAWVNDEITITQINKVIGGAGGNIYSKLAIALKKHINSKKIKL